MNNTLTKICSVCIVGCECMQTLFGSDHLRRVGYAKPRREVNFIQIGNIKSLIGGGW